MDKRQIYTALIGVLGVLFAFTAVRTDFSAGMQFILGMLGALVFLWAALSMFFEWRRLQENIAREAGTYFDRDPRRIVKIELLSEENSVVSSWDLYQKTSAVIGRDCGENQVDIDLSHSEYGALVSIHHAVLNYAEGNWYVEDIGSQNGVTVQKKSDGRKYKISPDQPCKLDCGDILHIGMSRLRLC